jgi:hypothetical protein
VEDDGGVGTPGAALRALLAAALGVATLAACSSVPTSPPTGVDELVVPTPSPDASDFVARIDNPWLSWEPGATTTLVEQGQGADPDQEVSVGVADATVPVAGLAATVVTTTTAEGDTTDWFAQDRGGNVWWLGRYGQWQAGRDGATAGLWMPAAPRTGDGFEQGVAPGVVDDVATVLEAPEPDAAPTDDDEPAQTRIEVVSDLEPGATVVRTYVRGRGLTSEVLDGAGGYVRLLDDR